MTTSEKMKQECNNYFKQISEEMYRKKESYENLSNEILAYLEMAGEGEIYLGLEPDDIKLELFKNLVQGVAYENRIVPGLAMEIESINHTTPLIYAVNGIMLELRQNGGTTAGAIAFEELTNPIYVKKVIDYYLYRNLRAKEQVDSSYVESVETKKMVSSLEAYVAQKKKAQHFKK